MSLHVGFGHLCLLQGWQWWLLYETEKPVALCDAMTEEGSGGLNSAGRRTGDDSSLA
jgi:hypothetical protein